MDSILMATEIEMYVDTMEPQKMEDIGTKTWLDWHQRLQKLNQEALLEASQVKDEHVKETLVCYQKVPVLVHEVILINIWKQKVLPQLLKLVPNPPSTFLAYTILYHEAVCVALLELIMYHENCCEALGDSAADLLDYVSGTCSQLLTVQHKEAPKNEQQKDELARQLQNLTFDIGLRSLTIIRYLAERIDGLPLTISTRIYETHDIPILFIQLLLEKPWIKNNTQYVGGRWTAWDGEALGQAEAQVWLTLRHLLLDPTCRQHYPVTDARRCQIIKLVALLTPTLLDQLSPLTELKNWLSRICMAEQPPAAPKPILMEVILEVKEKILQQCGGQWKKIAKSQAPIIFCSDKKSLMETAQKLSEAYNTDLLEKLESKPKATCEICGKNAIQRCSRCKKTWYCSRACQVTHWPMHKDGCN